MISGHDAPCWVCVGFVVGRAFCTRQEALGLLRYATSTGRARRKISPIGNSSAGAVAGSFMRRRPAERPELGTCADNGPSASHICVLPFESQRGHACPFPAEGGIGWSFALGFPALQASGADFGEAPSEPTVHGRVNSPAYSVRLELGTELTLGCGDSYEQSEPNRCIASPRRDRSRR